MAHSSELATERVELPAPVGAAAPAASRRERWRQARSHITLVLAAVAITAASLALEVPDQEHVTFAGLQLPPTCVWRSTLGFPCAGCGLTRSFVALVHGEWSRAFSFHPLGPVLFALLWAQVPYRGLHAWQAYHGRPLWRPRYLLWIPLAFALALLVVWVWRTVLLFW